jgi:hypothetical protein
MKMIRIVRKYKMPAEIRQRKSGDIIEYDENDGPPYVEIFEVSDSNHQSSLDYLKGI